MKRILWLLPVVVALLTACGGQQAEPQEAPRTGLGEVFQIALPRVVIDVDSAGVPSIAGISPLFLTRFGVDVSGIAVPEDTVRAMVRAGVQHIEAASVGDRLVLLVNAKPMPQLGWSEASLQRALDLAAAFDVQNTEAIGKVLTWVTRLGLDVAVRFPRDGATEIPLSDSGTAQHSLITPVSSAPYSLKFEIRFDQEGVPAILGVSARDLADVGVKGIGGLSPETLLKLQSENIQSLELRNKPDGLRIYVNGQPLPVIIWDSERLADFAGVYGRLDPDGALRPLIEVVLPQLDQVDLGILLHFPPGPGQQQIPAQMHE